MSNRKKSDGGKTSGGRQSSLFAFGFQRSAGDSSTVTKEEVESPNRSVEQMKRTISVQKEKEEVGEEFAILSSSSKPKTKSNGEEQVAKRRRVVFSSDEEEEVVGPVVVLEDEEKTKTPVNYRKVDRKRPFSSNSAKKKTNTNGSPRLVNASTPTCTISAETLAFFDACAAGQTGPSPFFPPSTDRKEKQTARSLAEPYQTERHFPHLDLDFLKPDRIRDAHGRRPNDPDYEPHTLFIPDEYFQKQTPGHRQWWNLKRNNFDTILLFKVGKFYELYHMDAVIGVNVLALVFMRGNYAHAGFPEISYGSFSDQLVSRGYKVARIEQTETPAQLEKRQEQKIGKVKEKVVKRELCRVTTQATRTFGCQDGNDDRDTLDAIQPQARYLLAVNERCTGTVSSYGVCFADTTVGKFQLGQFVDDQNRSFLRTLLAHNQPAQILYERGRVSPGTQAVWKGMAMAAQKEALASKKEFLPAEKTLHMLTSKNYLDSELSAWPETLKEMLIDPDNQPLPSCRPEFEQCISALGAILWYLKRCLIDVDLVTMRNFIRYIPPGIIENRLPIANNSPDRWTGKRLVLDGITLFNLNIVPPSESRKRRMDETMDPSETKFSLYNTVNQCKTPFGKRLLRQWICAPPCDPVVINARQETIAVLIQPECSQLVKKLGDILRLLPDLERLLQKIHTLGLKYRATEHPDGRAVFFEAHKYNKRKVGDLVSALNGFTQVIELRQMIMDNRRELAGSQLLQRCFIDQFPEIATDLAHFKKAFDWKKAAIEGKIVPETGIDEEYDKANVRLAECNRQLDMTLVEERKKLKCHDLEFFGTARNRFQLEIPDRIALKLGDEYELKSQRKGFRRFSTAKLDRQFADLVEAENERNTALGDVMRRVFADFDRRHKKWSMAVEKVAVFDVLLGLAKYANTCGQQMVRPEFIVTDQPMIEIDGGYHPCLVAMLAQSPSTVRLIPNDCRLDGLLLLTGANMGGKSTLMRQGAFVPATRMRLSPVDRMFTRIGANDRLAAGQSTFFVELNETNVILRNATRDSLLVIDELGRGTSTHDGTAIAYAVLRNLTQRGSRCFFSTHYHNLVEKVRGNEKIAFGHMACMVEHENEADPTSECVTFLYTLTEGICPKSYGFYAAKVSGIKREVIRRAHVISQEMISGNLEQVRKKMSAREKLGLLRQAAANPNTPMEQLKSLLG